MAYDYENDLVTLQAAVMEKEQQVRQLEAEIAELEQEIAAFRVRYDQKFNGMIARAEAAEAVITQLETERAERYSPTQGIFIPAEPRYTTYRERPSRAQEPIEMPPTAADPAPSDIKQLYRQLARRFHPDFAQDAADREQRTVLMAMINDAYAQGDYEALRLLTETDAPEAVMPSQFMPSTQSLTTLQAHQLRQTLQHLTHEIDSLTAQHHELLNGAWMQLKLDEKLLKFQGRDLFDELTRKFDQEYSDLQAKIDRLRNPQVS